MPIGLAQRQRQGFELGRMLLGRVASRARLSARSSWAADSFRLACSCALVVLLCASRFSSIRRRSSAKPRSRAASCRWVSSSSRATASWLLISTSSRRRALSRWEAATCAASARSPASCSSWRRPCASTSRSWRSRASSARTAAASVREAWAAASAARCSACASSMRPCGGKLGFGAFCGGLQLRQLPARWRTGLAARCADVRRWSVSNSLICIQKVPTKRHKMHRNRDHPSTEAQDDARQQHVDLA